MRSSSSLMISMISIIDIMITIYIDIDVTVSPRQIFKE